jgi:hypothetical protein
VVAANGLADLRREQERVWWHRFTGRINRVRTQRAGLVVLTATHDGVSARRGYSAGGGTIALRSSRATRFTFAANDPDGIFIATSAWRQGLCPRYHGVSNDGHLGAQIRLV